MRIFCFDQIDPYSDELALLYERERQQGNGNRATLAVARKMVVWNGQESSLVFDCGPVDRFTAAYHF